MYNIHCTDIAMWVAFLTVKKPTFAANKKNGSECILSNLIFLMNNIYYLYLTNYVGTISKSFTKLCK